MKKIKAILLATLLMIFFTTEALAPITVNAEDSEFYDLLIPNDSNIHGMDVTEAYHYYDKLVGYNDYWLLSKEEILTEIKDVIDTKERYDDIINNSNPKAPDAIEFLTIANNSNFDYSVFSNVKEVTIVDCSNLDFLNTLPEDLRFLSLIYCNFEDGVLPDLSRFSDLTWLEVINCNVSNIDSIINIPKVYSVQIYNSHLQGTLPDLYDMNITELTIISNNEYKINEIVRLPKNIERVTMQGHKISDIRPFITSNATSANLNYNCVKDINAIYDVEIPTLHFLELEKQIIDIELDNNGSFTYPFMVNGSPYIYGMPSVDNPSFKEKYNLIYNVYDGITSSDYVPTKLFTYDYTTNKMTIKPEFLNPSTESEKVVSNYLFTSLIEIMPVTQINHTSIINAKAKNRVNKKIARKLSATSNKIKQKKYFARRPNRMFLNYSILVKFANNPTVPPVTPPTTPPVPPTPSIDIPPVMPSVPPTPSTDIPPAYVEEQEPVILTDDIDDDGIPRDNDEEKLKEIPKTDDSSYSYIKRMIGVLVIAVSSLFIILLGNERDRL